MMSRKDIDCCRRIGREEDNRISCIGLTELDALCAQAEAAIDLWDACKEAVLAFELEVSCDDPTIQRMKAALAKADTIAPAGDDRPDKPTPDHGTAYH